MTRLAPLLIGQDPLFVERLWERMYRADRGIKRQGIAAYALSALDIALWDIAGKAAGLPLYKLWGAVTDRVAAYGSGGWPSYALEDLIGEAQAYVARGCRYYKMKKRPSLPSGSFYLERRLDTGTRPEITWTAGCAGVAPGCGIHLP